MSASPQSTGRRRFALLLGLVLALSFLAVAAMRARRPRPNASSRPNVIYIVVDAMRADRLSCYGYHRPTSPNLAALAQESFLFEDAMSQASETPLSVPSLLTGRRVNEHGQGWFQQGSKVYVQQGASLPMLTEILHDHGYTTAAFCTNELVGPGIGAERGFDLFDRPVGPLPAQEQGSAKGVNACVFQWLRGRRAGDGPFFLYLHYFDPHGIYLPPPEFCVFGRPGATERDCRRNTKLIDCYDAHRDWEMTASDLAKHGLSPADLARLSDLYDGEVLCADHYLGELVKQLKELGLYEHTILVITADHGEALWEHGFLKHGGALYQELVHVPLLMRFPELSGGRRLPELVETVDIVPTLLAACGIETSLPFSGQNLWPNLRDGLPLAERVGISEAPPKQMVAVRVGSLKLIESPGRVELYDLSSDPGETRNLATSRPKDVARLRAARLRELTRRPTASSRTRPMTPEELRALKSLGYVK